MRASKPTIEGLLLLAASTAAQTVEIANGTIQGGKCKSTSSNYFYSIPYAEPPTGDRRLKAPQPYLSAYDGTLDATIAAASCIQFNKLFAESNTQSEDWYAESSRRTCKQGLIFSNPVCTWIYGPPAPQQRTRNCQSKSGFMAAAMKQEASQIQPTTAATPLKTPS